MINSVTIAGNMTRDVEIRRTQSGTVVASFGVAVNERRKNNRTGEWEDVPNYFDVTAFGERWEKLAQYIPKGAKVTVQGKLRWSQWERDGQKRSKVDIIADDIELPPRQGGGQQRTSKPLDGGYRQEELPPTSVYDDDIPF